MNTKIKFPIWFHLRAEDIEDSKDYDSGPYYCYYCNGDKHNQGYKLHSQLRDDKNDNTVKIENEEDLQKILFYVLLFYSRESGTNPAQSIEEIKKHIGRTYLINEGV